MGGRCLSTEKCYRSSHCHSQMTAVIPVAAEAAIRIKATAQPGVLRLGIGSIPSSSSCVSMVMLWLDPRRHPLRGRFTLMPVV